jgi:uncharacterized protein YnzC (UPF0291/DUF896 family)
MRSVGTLSAIPREQILILNITVLLAKIITIKVVDPIGQDVTPDKVYDLRQQYGYIQN